MWFSYWKVQVQSDNQDSEVRRALVGADVMGFAVMDTDLGLRRLGRLDWRRELWQ